MTNPIVIIVFLLIFGFVMGKYVLPLLNQKEPDDPPDNPPDNPPDPGPHVPTGCFVDSDCRQYQACVKNACTDLGPSNRAIQLVDIQTNNVIGTSKKSSRTKLEYGKSDDLLYTKFMWDDASSQFYLLDNDTNDKLSV